MSGNVFVFQGNSSYIQRPCRKNGGKHGSYWKVLVGTSTVKDPERMVEISEIWKK